MCAVEIVKKALTQRDWADLITELRCPRHDIELRSRLEGGYYCPIGGEGYCWTGEAQRNAYREVVGN